LPRLKTWAGARRRSPAGGLDACAGSRAGGRIWDTAGRGEPELARKCDAFQLVVNLEQQPNPENRIALASQRDVFGVPRVELTAMAPREQEQLERLRAVLAAGLEAAHLGRVTIRAGMTPDPNAHTPRRHRPRMHADPRYGVVDADGRVHGTDNVYVAGSSGFPTAGFANPTLTIVALALRLADHLKARI